MPAPRNEAGSVGPSIKETKAATPTNYAPYTEPTPKAPQKSEEQVKKEESEKKVSEYKKGLSEASGKVETELKKGAAETEAAGAEYSKKLEGLVKQTQELSKWHEGLVTSYEGIADRYRKAFEESEKQKQQEQATAQRDYGANAALMSRAAAVGMSGMGPMTGAQQQLMMATAQQQATSAYSTAQDRIAAMDMQRRQLGAQVVQSSMAQELQNRQSGYSMQAGGIQAQAGLYGQQYGASMAGIDARTNAAIYGGQAQMGIETAGMQYATGLDTLNQNTTLANAQIAAMQNMPGVQGPSKIGTAMTRGLSGAATGAAIGSVVPGIGTAVGAGVGAGIGILSSFV